MGEDTNFTDFAAAASDSSKSQSSTDAEVDDDDASDADGSKSMADSVVELPAAIEDVPFQSFATVVADGHTRGPARG